MKKIFLCTAFCSLVMGTIAQNVGINNTDPKAALDINGNLRLRQQSTNVTGTTVQLASNRTNHLLTGSPTGDFDITFSGTIEMGQHLIITNSTLFSALLPQIVIPPNITAEFTYSGINWQLIGSNELVTNSAWGLFGNQAAVGAKLGHTDNRAIQFISNDEHVGRLGGNNNILLGLRSGNNLSQIASPGSFKNIAIGDDALKTASSATYNIAIGHNAMADATGGGTGIAIGGSALNNQAPGALENIAIGYSSQAATTSGSYNLSVGRQSLFKNTIGSNNVAHGAFSLEENTTGSTNVAVGYSSAAKNTTGYSNVAIGTSALFKNTTNSNLVAIGDSALFFNGTGATVFNDAKNNTAVGSKALYANTIGNANTAVGYNSLMSNTIGTSNTAHGFSSLLFNTTGDNNTAQGVLALKHNTTGSWNSAQGYVAMFDNTTGEYNTAMGAAALMGNFSGKNNTGMGYGALKNNSGGHSNVAVGVFALSHTFFSRSNIVAIGDSALYNNGMGSTLAYQGTKNTAVGSKALLSNGSGYANTAIGFNGLLENVNGYENTAIGANALLNGLGNGNTAVGSYAILNNQSSNNTALGSSTLNNNLAGTGNVAIGYFAGFNELGSNKLYIQNTGADKDNALIYGDFAADSLLLNAKTINRNSFNIRTNNALEMGYGTTGKQTDAGKICYGCFGDPAHWLGIVGGGTNSLGTDRVIKLWSEGGLRVKGDALPDATNTYTLGNSGQRWKEVWTNAGAINTSDARLKTNIASSRYGLDEVMKMQPVQYNWKTNPNNDLQIGFLAQDIQKLIPEAVVEPANGDPMGMKYTELIPVLVKGMQEQQKLIESQQKQIDELHKLLKAKQ